MSGWAASTDLAPEIFWLLVGVSTLGSFITVTMGIGGGVLVLAVMANFIPSGALIPVHGLVQLGSNLYRSVLFRNAIKWVVVPRFVAGSIIGVVLGGMLVVELPPAIIQLCVGMFALWSLLGKSPAWLGQRAVVVGGVSSFLTMFFGATGVFVGKVKGGARGTV